MNTVHEQLINAGFKQTEDKYILFTVFGEFILKEEHRLTERYTCRDYIINTESETFSGKIYTNNPENFSLTLNRLLNQFNSFNMTNFVFPKNEEKQIEILI
ncbi:hypothetical protein CON36_17675 [Bacillus cereus]|uniref:Uncharacterized protein n=2 Tax=Bacillus cereus group TaxID=86661 RepID=A0A9X6ZSJ1_BACTU|nr:MULTISPECIES: hypothetical protein [Bacillus cereus group]PDZ97448.1 hypothetical protein CON36_17675 [Bacillus cereus]PFJ38811.1 hypothetical protein COJ15_17185 [Bacillus thuringiensis]PGP11900.1 hypothetical protein COA01_34330 [Bacillus cereus]